MKLEVIAKNLNDVIKINKSNASRIEFCRNLEVGGLTPNKLIIWLATRISKLPINVMLRPSDRSFNYTEKEFKKMLKMAKFIAKTKANAVVLGILDEKNEIDVLRMNQILNLLPNKQKTFHKAFDQVPDFNQALNVLTELKVDHVLTAGGQEIDQNLEILAQLKNAQKISILAGGGVTFDNVEKIVPVVNEIHVGRVVRKNNSWNSKIDIQKINDLVQVLNK